MAPSTKTFLSLPKDPNENKMNSDWTYVGPSKDDTDFNNGQYLVNNAV